MGMAEKSSGPPLSVEEYLKYEAESPVRHEYVAGDIFAMAGTSLKHNRIALRLSTELSNRLWGGPCQTYMSDAKVRLKINTDEYFYYPDVTVGCNREDEEKHYLRHPKLIIEVLSPSTEAIDRREKAAHYRCIPTLEEYVLVAQDISEVTISRRSENWRSFVATSEDERVDFRSVGVSLTIAEIYDSERKKEHPATQADI